MLFLELLMIFCVTRPETAITIMVDTMITIMYGRSDGFMTDQDSIRPTAAGMNMTGMISIRKMPVSLTSSAANTLDSINACRNRQRDQIMQDLTKEGYQQDNNELF